MTLEEKDSIRTEIENRIMKIEQNISALQEETVPIPPSVALWRLTRMDAIQQKSIAEANIKSDKESLIRLRSALERLDDPDFGLCLICKQAIPTGRLTIIPESRVCVKCSSKKKI
ncbi:MAG: hypothetical protein JXR70_13845 [Spirochaetales bacterium]|nr:hypothetical protein [Spirochaetales bacterium]